MQHNKTQTLNEFQKSHPNGFKSIALDISGFCNAKCKYCPAGNDLSHKGEFIPLQRYEQLLEKLETYKLVSASTDFQIYGLGEPLLHPELDQILKMTGKHNLKINISTNASIVPKVSPEATKCVSRILISMPGFSQESYDKIHGFCFEKIKENILRLKELFPSTPFDMTYHIYQFNLDEMDFARFFCEQNDIRFAPNYAVLFDRIKCLDYVNNRMSYEELKDISKDLFLQVLDHEIQVSPRNYCDFRENYLSVNIHGEVRICSSFPKSYEPNILCGNLLKDDISEILQKKCSHSFCDTCIGSGLTFAEGYDCKSFPNFYFSLMRENEFLRDHFVQDPTAVSGKIRFMHQVRFWEQEHYSQEELKKTLEVLKEEKLKSAEIRDIVCKYARFKKATYERLFPHISKLKEML